MDDLEALYYINRDKAISALTAADNLLIFLMVSFISVFIPLAYTVTSNSQDMTTIFMNFVMGIPVVIIPLLVFFLAKYREYRYQYTIYLIKSIVWNNFHPLPDSQSLKPTYDEVCRRIVNITDFKYNEVMTLLLKIYPPP